MTRYTRSTLPGAMRVYRALVDQGSAFGRVVRFKRVGPSKPATASDAPAAPSPLAASPDPATAAPGPSEGR